MNDLDYVTTDDLIKELQRRHEGGIIVLNRDTQAGREANLLQWWGGLRGLGLLSYATPIIHSDYMGPDAEWGGEPQ